MCRHGTIKLVKLNRPREVSGRTGVPVDACIADEVQSLNDAGVWTLGSCCGHSKENCYPHVLIAKESMRQAIELGYNPKPYDFEGISIIRLKEKEALACAPYNPN